jgi:uncharacterized protein YgiM (DUF1202 family)
VFVNPNSTIIAKDHPRAVVLVLSQLLAWVMKQPNRLSPQQVDAISTTLTNAAKKSSESSSIVEQSQSSNPIPNTTSEPHKKPFRTSPKLWIGLLAVLIVFVLAIAGGAYLLTGVSGFFGPHSQGCSVVATSYVRSGPSLQEKLLGTAPKGTCLSFDGRTKDDIWIRISSLGKFQGGWTLVSYFDLKSEQIKLLPVLK